MTENNDDNHVTTAGMPRKEKRKLLKKLKRKQLRKETAIKEKETADDPEETARLLVLEKEKAERMERDRIAFEERERLFLLELEWKNELLRQQLESEEVTNGDEDESNDGEGVDWEYVEEGPAEIIWKGNEIIVKKKKVKVPKKVDNHIEKKESERPISNQLAPQCEAYNDYRSAQEVLESVAQQVPNFGTEQDKAHCPFHLKTGVCRFGASCSRAHFYPDKSCTLLFKNMYNGPGLGCNQDEGLEYTDEEVERSFEEFYEDVHTEFLKYGEITNFKVCKNASSHLRGNVYVHYKSLESAVRAYQSINGRYFAGKQLSCEFVNLTKWKVAICGEYIRSRLKTCSRGSACNFIHCFRNPGGDYEWADWDKPAPRYWLKEMGALFGYTDDKFTDATVSYHSKRSRSRSRDSSHRKIHSDDDDDDGHRRRSRQRPRSDFEEKISPPENNRIKRRKTDSLDKSECSSDEQKPGHKSSNNSRWERDQESTRRVRMKREHHSKADDSESRKRKKDDKSLNRQKNEYEPVHERHRSYKKNDSKKSPQVDREVSKYSLERDEDKSYNHRAKSSRASDGGKIETDEKRTHKKYKSRRPDNPTDSIDSESEGRLHRSTKKHKRVKHEAESSYNASDEGMSRKYEKEPKKDRRTRSKSKKLDTEHSQCEDINSTKDHKCNDLEMENPSPTNKSSKGSTTYKTEEACFRSLDGKAEDDLEQTFRLAALKKLEEKRKCKDSLPVESRMSNVWVDIQSHENVVGEDAEGSKELAEISPSREARTSSASVRRKRI